MNQDTGPSVMGLLKSGPYGIEPYTPEDIAAYQDEAVLQGKPDVPMNPYRVQVSVEAAMLRGWHGYEEHVEEQSQQDRRDKWIVKRAVLVIIALFFGVLAVVSSYLPTPPPGSLPQIQSE